ncbi:MAG: AAA family ATPase [Leptospiraceae bacterium]|nr:AAA family ATPase [Leptospiraceae bacterium]
MELLYVWIENYKNIYHQGFNFSPRYRFDFKPTEFETKKSKNEDGEKKKIIKAGKLFDKLSSLDFKEKENPFHFFEPSDEMKEVWKKNHPKQELGEITNISAIVGQNGAGKSNLLNLIPTILQYDKKILYILLLLDTDGRTIFCKHSSQLIVSHNFKSLKVGENINAEIFFFSGPPSKEIDAGKNVDLTLHGIRKKNSIKERHLDIESENLLDQIEFILNGNISLPFVLPESLECKVKESYLEDRDNSDKIKKYIKTRVDKLESDFVAKYQMKLDYFKKRIDLSIIQNNFDNFIFDLRKKLDQINLEQYSLEKFLNYLHKMPHYETVEKMFLNLENLSNNVGITDPKTFYIKLKISQKENITNFIRNYMESIAQSHYMKFDWRDISSGESAMLTLYSRFFSTVEQQTKSDSSILILIDEGEVGFHPEWQRRYLKYLIDFFPQIYPGRKIQIILTTHSPFLASDLPKENIIFLRKAESKTKEEKAGNYEMIDGVEYENGKCIVVDGLKEKKQTFGANIHTLFSDSFFLEGGLIGEFANGKISDTLKIMNPLLLYSGKERQLEFDKEKTTDKQKKKILEKEIKELWNSYSELKKEFDREKVNIKRLIDIIGEPIIQDKLLQMYYSIESKDEKEAQINFYQEKIDRLNKK